MDSFFVPLNEYDGKSRNSSFLNGFAELKDWMNRKESVQIGNESGKNSQKTKDNNGFHPLSRNASKNNINTSKNNISGASASRNVFLDVSRKMSVFAVNNFYLSSMKPISNDQSRPGSADLHRDANRTVLGSKWKDKKNIGSETETLMLKVLSSPISLGYFMAFCESEYNAEYLSFYVAVADLKSASGFFDCKAIDNSSKTGNSIDAHLESSSIRISRESSERFCIAIDKINFDIKDRLLVKRTESNEDGRKSNKERNLYTQKCDRNDSFLDKNSVKITKATIIWNKYLNANGTDLGFPPISTSASHKPLTGQHIFLSKRVLNNTLLRIKYV